jgi:hypothetical protein
MILVRPIVQLWARRRGDEGSLWCVGDKRDGVYKKEGRSFAALRGFRETE